MRELSAIAGNLQRKFGINFEVVSGGNSANYQWFVSTPDVGLVNHLRIGEAMLLGCDTLNRERIPGLYTDAFTLVAEVIELVSRLPEADRRTIGRFLDEFAALVARRSAAPPPR